MSEVTNKKIKNLEKQINRLKNIHNNYVLMGKIFFKLRWSKLFRFLFPNMVDDIENLWVFVDIENDKICQDLEKTNTIMENEKEKLLKRREHIKTEHNGDLGFNSNKRIKQYKC